jgi:hypothetical protein
MGTANTTRLVMHQFNNLKIAPHFNTMAEQLPTQLSQQCRHTR